MSRAVLAVCLLLLTILSTGIAQVGTLRTTNEGSKYSSSQEAVSAFYEALSFYQQNRVREAIALYRKALKLDPHFSAAKYNLAAALFKADDVPGAVRYYDELVRYPQKGFYTDAHVNLGTIYTELRRYDKAIASFEVVLENSLSPSAVVGLLRALRAQARWSQAYTLLPLALSLARDALAEGELPALTPDLSLLCGAPIDLVFDITRAYATEAARMASERGARPFEVQSAATVLSRYVERANEAGKPVPLRIGYVSSEFRDTEQSYRVQDILRLHNASQADIFCFSTGRDDSSLLRRIVHQRCSHWVDLRTNSTAGAAEVIQSKGIDVLVDLVGPANPESLELFSLRPAPIQVLYLGYPGTSGADYYDYIMTDALSTEAPLQHQYFTERFVYLPVPYQVFEHKAAYPHLHSHKLHSSSEFNSFFEEYGYPLHLPHSYIKQDQILTRASAGLPPTGCVYGNFNPMSEIDPVIFRSWMEILRQVPDSVLWLLMHPPTGETGIREAVKAYGIARERVIFAEWASWKQTHVARTALIDIGLDTHVYSSNHALANMLWMGIPVVAFPGATMSSRGAASMLTHLGCEELITTSFSEYEHKAIYLAKQPHEWHKIHQKLLSHQQYLPPFDTGRVVVSLERAYQVMFELRTLEFNGHVYIGE